MEKRCSTCKITKPVTEFSKGNRKDGLRSNCKACQSKYYRLHYEVNPDAYKSVKPQRLIDLYNRMLEAQNGVCAICKTSEPGGHSKVAKFHMDHDHKTGEYRGLLCFSCNTGLGKFYDNIELLKSAIRYLDNPTERVLLVKANISQRH